MAHARIGNLSTVMAAQTQMKSAIDIFTTTEEGTIKSTRGKEDLAPIGCSRSTGRECLRHLG
jgi:uncharacterized protein YijF (DUF1287 family)